jgi:hypothetical protein
MRGTEEAKIGPVVLPVDLEHLDVTVAERPRDSAHLVYDEAQADPPDDVAFPSLDELPGKVAGGLGLALGDDVLNGNTDQLFDVGEKLVDPVNVGEHHAVIGIAFLGDGPVGVPGQDLGCTGGHAAAVTCPGAAQSHNLPKSALEVF